MIVNKIGNYKFLKDFTTRGSFSIGTISAGTTIYIGQIDKIYHKVMSSSFFDWEYWDLPVMSVEG